MTERYIEHSYQCIECDRTYTDPKSADDHATKQKHHTETKYRWRFTSSADYPHLISMFGR